MQSTDEIITRAFYVAERWLEAAKQEDEYLYGDYTPAAERSWYVDPETGLTVICIRWSNRELKCWIHDTKLECQFCLDTTATVPPILPTEIQMYPFITSHLN